MRWNPFDRRSLDHKAIDDAVVGLDKPRWQEAGGARTAHFVREALVAWRTARATPDTDPTVKRLNKVRQVVDRDRGGATPVDADVSALLALRSTVRGRAVYAVAVLASAVESLAAWQAPEVAHRIVQIDLSAEVASVARSASLLQGAFDRLGDEPTGHLAKDDEVQAIYRQRTEALAARQTTLCRRLTSLRAYLDGLMEIERELEKVRWIEQHGSPDLSEFEALEGDELASFNLGAARDMFDAATDRIGVQLREAAKRLSEPS